MNLPYIPKSADTPLDQARKHYQRMLDPVHLSETRSYDQALREQALGLALVETALAMEQNEHILVYDWMKEQGGGTLEEFFRVFPYVGMSLGLLGLALVGDGKLYAGPEAREALYKIASEAEIKSVELGGRTYALNELHLAVVRRKPKDRKKEWV